MLRVFVPEVMDGSAFSQNALLYLFCHLKTSWAQMPIWREVLLSVPMSCLLHISISCFPSWIPFAFF